MRKVFADSVHWIALLDKHDQLHEKAVEISKSAVSTHIVTSEMVLTEVVNSLGKTPDLRGAVCAFTDGLRANPNVTIVPQTSILFQKAIDLFRQRLDKTWSLTDCASMIIANEHQITEILTYDLDFVQAGFVALLRT